MKFTVIDPKTGKYPDIRAISQAEGWAYSLKVLGMSGFVLDEDGVLGLIDRSGQIRWPPVDRFVVKEVQ